MNESYFYATPMNFTVWKQTQKKRKLFFCFCLTDTSRDSSNMVSQKNTSDALNQSFYGTKFFKSFVQTMNHFKMNVSLMILTIFLFDAMRSRSEMFMFAFIMCNDSCCLCMLMVNQWKRICCLSSYKYNDWNRFS